MMYDVPVLMLHTVNDHPKQNPLGALSVSSKGLEAYMKVFQRWKYQMISMDDLIRKNYDAVRPYVVLTFDDGFKDNLTIALPILKKYKARATIFVNPAYISSKSDADSDWGFMTWDEIRQAADSGVFDIQAHTMTHEFIFTSDKVVDYYTPEKFDQYYWLAWMLYPEAPTQWDSTVMKYRDKIPVGYPIFEYGRRLSSRKFTPSQAYIGHLIRSYKQDGSTETEAFTGNRGEYETGEEYLAYARWEVVECKRVLEETLKTSVHTLCFPGGGYTDDVLEIAEKTGYRCFMNASRLRQGNNHDHIRQLYDGEFVGLNRTSFSLIHPGLLPDRVFDYWVAKLSLGSYQNKKPYGFIKKVMAKLCRG